ncbi:DUF2905 domain-containing protein [Thermodesulfovibrio sp.]|jgi:hypothetical protein|uniref:DUF2905 domain-containing protein n=1 Tax=Thermodesulfovibrio TaxID=28261 RepID=UPI0026390D2D|nr:DUF2905 domain-containing protein [Thermodesulfovibrio sp.]
MSEIGKLLILIGALIIIIGVLITFAGKIPFIGKLPGDIVIERKNFTLYLPIGTSILISIILSLIFYLFHRR